jgi:hypothetical protein
MTANDLWNLCYERWWKVDGNPVSMREIRAFDFHGLKADYRWGGGNVLRYRVYLDSGEIIEMFKPGVHSPQWWLNAPSDAALVEIALRIEWVAQ